jgi:hypothetical protein
MYTVSLVSSRPVKINLKVVTNILSILLLYQSINKHLRYGSRAGLLGLNDETHH